MTYQTLYTQKLAYLKDELGPDCISVPRAARFIGMDEGTLRNDPTFPVFMVNSRRRVAIDSFARWLCDKELKEKSK